MQANLVPEERMARNYEQELSELKEEFEKLQEHLSNVEVRYQTEIQETNKQKENDFAVRLLNVVTNLFGRSQYSDLKILLENGNELCVHKLVLLSRSDDWDVPDLDEVDVLDLKGVKYDVAYSMLKWVYTDQIEFEENEENLVEMLKLSTKYKLEPLQTRCQNFMIEIVNVDNCNTFYQAANETASELLKDYCQEFLSKHQMKVDRSCVWEDGTVSPDAMASEDDNSTQEGTRSKSKRTSKRKSTNKKAEVGKRGKETQPEPNYVICEVCRKSFHSEEEIVAHSLIHDGNLKSNNLICYICRKGQRNLKDMKTCNMENGENQLVCSQCVNTDQNKPRFEKIYKEHPYQCGICKKWSLRKNYLIDHIRTHTGEKPYQCEICGQGFARNSVLVLHRRKHTGEKPCICDICDTKFMNRTHLNRHRLIHSGQKPFQCVECGKFFRQSHHLVNHMLVHSGERKWQCEICDKSFTLKQGLEKHVKTHDMYSQDRSSFISSDGPSVSTGRTSLSSQSSSQQHCVKRSKRKSKTREESEGDESYIATDELNVDFEQEQLDTSSLKTPQIYPYICNLCRKAIHEPSDEPAHSVLHAECLYRSCAHCGEKSENSKSEISKKQFFRYKHPASQELRYFCKSCANKKEVVGSLEPCKNRLTDITCGRCSYHSQNRSHVLDHINTHTGAKPHVCDFCGIGFSHTVSLMSHRLIHTGEKPHQCADCGRQFRRKFHLNRHRLIHNGGKPYQCMHCGLFFRQSNTLKFHIQTHTGVKPHSCNLCDRQFCDRRSLRKHKESHHDQLRADDSSNVTTVNVMISDIPVVYEEMNIVNTELTGLPTE